MPADYNSRTQRASAIISLFNVLHRPPGLEGRVKKNAVIVVLRLCIGTEHQDISRFLQAELFFRLTWT